MESRGHLLLKIHNLIRGGLNKLRPAFTRRFHGGAGRRPAAGVAAAPGTEHKSVNTEGEECPYTREDPVGVCLSCSGSSGRTASVIVECIYNVASGIFLVDGAQSCSSNMQYSSAGKSKQSVLHHVG